MRISVLRASRLLVLVGLAGIGCGSVSPAADGAAGTGGGGSGGSDGGNDATDAAPPTADQACAAIAQALCARLADCAPFELSLLYGTAANCNVRVALGCSKDQSEPDSTRTPGEVVDCANALPAVACADLINNNFPTACQNPPGNRADGTGCGSSLQCMSTHCEKSGTACGTCAVRQATGGTCTVDEGCQVGLVCANAKCIAPRAVGGQCDDSHPCKASLYCSASTAMCAQHATGAGMACATDKNVCDVAHGFGCDTFETTPACEAVVVANGGDACGLVNGTLTVCPEFNDCTIAGGAVSGTCPNAPKDGDPCTLTNPRLDCVPPATCVGGVCRLPSVTTCN
jgi:hypothetical protein